MSRLVPLSHTCSDEYELRLLRAARSETPEPGQLEQLLDVLAEESAAGTEDFGEEPASERLAPESSRGRLGSFWDWLSPRQWPAPVWVAAALVVGVAGGVVLSVRVLHPGSSASNAVEPDPSRAALPVAAGAGSHRALTPEAPSSSAAPAEPVRKRLREEVKPRPADSMASETDLVDEARKALEAGNSAGALHALERHDRNFGSGALTHEAWVLRIRAELAAGDYRAAEASAHGFLAKYPESPYADRVRALLREAETARAAAP